MKVDIYQDTVCPWCRIGKAHLFEAMEAWDGDPIEVTWHAFLLDPTTPPEGRTFASLVEKFGSEERVHQMHDRVCQVGEACGLDFNFDQIQQFPNTIQSHQLIQITPPALQTQMSDAITGAYFEQGRDIGKLSVLLDVAEEVGLDRTVTEEKMQRGEGLELVQQDIEFARQAGISGVPMFVINDRYGISGAQPVEVFLEAFREISKE